MGGVCLAVAFAGLAVGLAVWSRRLIPTGGYVEEHEGFTPPPAEQAMTAAVFHEPDSPTRRWGLLAALGFALTALGVAALFPLRSLLPWDRQRPGRALKDTPWGPGVRLVDGEGRPLRPADVPADTLVGVFPEETSTSGMLPRSRSASTPSGSPASPPVGTWADWSSGRCSAPTPAVRYGST